MTIKVLVMDSGTCVQQLAKDTLLPLGCQVITASSPALAMFLARKNRPCLIVNAVNPDDADIDLPQELLADSDLARIPVVIVFAQSATAKSHVAPYAARVIKCPVSSDHFFDEIRPFLVESAQQTNPLDEQTTQ